MTLYGSSSQISTISTGEFRRLQKLEKELLEHEEIRKGYEELQSLEWKFLADSAIRHLERHTTMTIHDLLISSSPSEAWRHYGRHQSLLEAQPRV